MVKGKIMNENEQAIIDLKSLDNQADLYGFQINSINLAISALEKQDSKKVKGISVTHEGYVGNCPLCGKFIRYKENTHFCNHKNCGQKLNWEETK